jgi:hypothetical protein
MTNGDSLKRRHLKAKLTSVIPVTREEEIRGSWFKTNLGKKVKDIILKKKITKRAGECG